MPTTRNSDYLSVQWRSDSSSSVPPGLYHTVQWLEHSYQVTGNELGGLLAMIHARHTETGFPVIVGLLLQRERVNLSTTSTESQLPRTTARSIPRKSYQSIT